ncbi:MAG: hypothetical protein WCT50_02285 [Patescibacteria group bacterium]|jgi:hypothetical protein
MNLQINALRAVTEIVTHPKDKVYVLKVTITGLYQERTRLHPFIVRALKASNLSVVDSMSLGETGPSVIEILNCTSLMFIDLVRKNNFFIIKEIEPEFEEQTEQ